MTLSQGRAKRLLLRGLRRSAYQASGNVQALCQDRFSSTILLGGPGVHGTNEEVSPDTSMCYLVQTVKSGSYGRSPGTREALGVSLGFAE